MMALPLFCRPCKLVLLLSQPIAVYSSEPKLKDTNIILRKCLTQVSSRLNPGYGLAKILLQTTLFKVWENESRL